MSQPFLGQIIEAGFNFAPIGYATCSGQLMSIAQNTALFALLGTTFGGDGQVTFGLPDLRGRVPIHQGTGAGLSTRTMGEVSGSESVTLTSNQMPQHNHQVNGVNANANQKTPANMLPGFVQGTATNVYSNAAANTTMSSSMIALAGGNQAHNNMQPYNVHNFCIAVEGIFPSRN